MKKEEAIKMVARTMIGKEDPGILELAKACKELDLKLDIVARIREELCND